VIRTVAVCRTEDEGRVDHDQLGLATLTFDEVPRGLPMLTTRIVFHGRSVKNSPSIPAPSKPSIGPAAKPAARTARMK
jgi:hypothetical protein